MVCSTYTSKRCNDFWNTPRYALIDLNLPPKIKDEEFEEMWLGIHEALMEINVMVVGGHTGIYEGTDYPMVGDLP